MSSAKDRRMARQSPRPHKQAQRSTGPRRVHDNRAAWLKARDSYLERARASAAAGDEVDAENFYQHAEHFHRMLSAEAECV